MTKKRATPRKKRTTLRSLEKMAGYRLFLQRAQTASNQLSFADLLGDWTALPDDPILDVQHTRLIEEIAELDCPTPIMFVDRETSQRDDGGGTAVVVENDEACILFSGEYNKRRSKKELITVMKVVLAIEDVLGFKTYDPQLGRQVDIRADMPDIAAAWASWQAKD